MLLIICKPSDLFYSQLYFKAVLTFIILNFHCAKKFIFRALTFFQQVCPSSLAMVTQDLKSMYTSYKCSKCLHFTKDYPT